jgi:hypothetical protein
VERKKGLTDGSRLQEERGGDERGGLARVVAGLSSPGRPSGWPLSFFFCSEPFSISVFFSSIDFAF